MDEKQRITLIFFLKISKIFKEKIQVCALMQVTLPVGMELLWLVSCAERGILKLRPYAPL
jgi:hypothetical protein